MAKTLLNPSYPSSYGNVIIGAAGGTCASTVYTISAGGSGGSNTYYTNGGSGTWASATTPYVTVGATTNSALKVSGDADIQGNLTVNGVDIGTMLTKIQDRLAILVPDPARLDKYEALKQAYEHYKILEALCIEEYDPGAKK
jgi:hypothetical protein